jgi:predicted RNase H-like nuclease
MRTGPAQPLPNGRTRGTVHFVGVNGCKAGWLGIALTAEGYAAHRVAADFSDIAEAYQKGLILVDVPIGLRDMGPAERLCDTAARRVLGPRSSSVFPAPCRSAISAVEYEAASTENRARTGRGLSKQSWAIVPKIRQLDDYLRQRAAQGPVVREVHPEVCF